MNKVLSIIQARMNSTRLPGKVLKKFGKITVLEYMIERAKRMKNVDKLVVATSLNECDGEIVKVCENLGIETFRGDEHDVLSRFFFAAKKYRSNHVLRLTADCPMFDPDVADEIIKLYFEKKVDYCSNTVDRTFADGLDAEVFSFNVLTDAFYNANCPESREHVTSFFNGRIERKKNSTYQYKYSKDFKNLRLTLDTKKDFEYISRIIKNLPLDYRWRDILKLYKKSPELFLIENKYE